MFRNFFYGRYGIDNFSLSLFIIALPFIRNNFLSVVAILLIGYGFYRAYSKDTNKRYQELIKFNGIVQNIRAFLTRQFYMLSSKSQPVAKKLSAAKLRFQQRKLQNSNPAKHSQKW